ncbi:pentapeptide repeat-containing protein [Mastigocoleus testarum]|nr:pentapeptide repeat-containing protein [Mastigocoleus testarum]
MTDSSRGGKKKKITYTASEEGVEKAEKALMRLGFGSKSNFAKSQLLSRTTVTKFFNRQPIQLDSFKRICDALKLSNWKEIAGIIEEAPGSLTIRNCNTSATLEGEEVQTISRQVTVIDRQNGTTKVVITLKGDINSVSSGQILQSILREYSGDTIKITDIQKGSIKLIIEGSQEDIEQLISRIKSKELKEVNGFPIENIRIEKWSLVEMIVSQGAKGRDLSGVDLSDVDLSGVDLSGADLSGADLSGADLIGADLSGADLSGADLSGADLSGANLSGADLSGTNISVQHKRDDGNNNDFNEEPISSQPNLISNRKNKERITRKSILILKILDFKILENFRIVSGMMVILLTLASILSHLPPHIEDFLLKFFETPIEHTQPPQKPRKTPRKHSNIQNNYS